MYKFLTIIIIFLLLVCDVAHAQSKVESDIAKLEKVMAMKDDTAKVNTFVTGLPHTKSFWFYNVFYNKVLIKAFDDMTALAEKLKFTHGAARIDYWKGFYYWGRNDCVKALDLDRSALSNAKKSGDQAFQAKVLDAIASIYGDLEYSGDKCLFYSKQALNMYTAIKDEAGICREMAYIAGIYHERKKIDTALIYDKKAEEIAFRWNIKRQQK